MAALLAALEGRPLDCWAFARDTPPGKDCVCRLLRARAWDARLPGAWRSCMLLCACCSVHALLCSGCRSTASPPQQLTSYLRALPPWLHADAQRTPVLAVELVGDRFLRRMVRVLVATAFREALPAAAWFAGQAHKAAAAADSPAAAAAADGEAAWDAGALLRAAAARDRQGTAPPAPSEGLCFLEAGYSAFAD